METRQLLIVTPPVPSAPPDKGFRLGLQEFFQYHSFVMKINLAPLRVYTKSPPPQRRMPGSSRQRLEASKEMHKVSKANPGASEEMVGASKAMSEAGALETGVRG